MSKTDETVETLLQRAMDSGYLDQLPLIERLGSEDGYWIKLAGYAFVVSTKRLEDSIRSFLNACGEADAETEQEPIVDVWESGVFPDD